MSNHNQTLLNVNAKETGVLVSKTMAMPRDTNANGDIFGGWLVSQMDLGAAILAYKHAKGRIVTVAIDGMSFLRPVHVGNVVCCYASCVHIGNASIKIKIEAWVMNTLAQDTMEKVTEGIFTFVAVDSNGCPKTIQK